MAGGNAVELMQILGLPVEPDGVIAADDLVDRIRFANLHPSVFRDDVHGREETAHGRVIRCGRRAGYLRDRLHALLEVATWAASHGEGVRWY